MLFHHPPAICRREVAQPARAQDTPDFRHHPFGIRNMFVDLGADDHVETAIIETQCHGIVDSELHVGCRLARLREQHRRLVDIDAGHRADVLGQELVDDPCRASQIQHIGL